jgi:hypothetical protein
MDPDPAVNQRAGIAPRQEAGHYVPAPERLRRRALAVTTVGYVG